MMHSSLKLGLKSFSKSRRCFFCLEIDVEIDDFFEVTKDDDFDDDDDDAFREENTTFGTFAFVA